MSHPVLQYSVEDERGLQRAETLVLLHGFPDGPALWEKTSRHLQEQGYRVVRITLPGFEAAGSAAGKHPAEGGFEEVVLRLHATLSEAQALGATILGHDWGAIFVYMLLRKYPDALSRVICLEIGGAPRSFLLTALVLFYHGLLNLGYVLGPGLGDALIRGVCFCLRRPGYEHAIKPLAGHAWLYRQAWREGGAEGPWRYYYRNGIASWTPPEGTPFLFLYGKESPKALRFHCEEWIQSVTASSPKSRAAGISGRHWFMLESPEDFHAELDAFLGETSEQRRDRG